MISYPAWPSRAGSFARAEKAVHYRSERGTVSVRLIWARRRPLARFAPAFALAASLSSILFSTSIAPAARASRVAVPLCWSTPVLPVRVARPPWTWTSNLSAPILDAAKRARIAFSSSASFGARRSADPRVAAVFFVAGAGLAAGCVWLNPGRVARRNKAIIEMFKLCTPYLLANVGDYLRRNGG